MRRFDRYFTSEFLRIFIFALVGFIFMFLAFKLLDVLKFNTRDVRVHLYYYVFYSSAEIVAQVIPAALLFGVCFAVSQFTMSREIVAMQSAGVSFYRAVVPVFITGVLMSMLLFFFQNFLVSPAKANAYEHLTRLKKDKAVVREVIWQRNLRGRKGYYFIYFFDKEKMRIIGGFNYLEMGKNGKPLRVYQASRAVYRKETKDWLLHKVMVLQMTEDVRTGSVEKHESLALRLPEDITFFSNPSRDPEELNIFELAEEIARRTRQGFSTVRYRVQYHANLSYPLMCLIVTMAGAIVGGMSSHRSTGPLIRSILISVATMLAYILLFNLGKNLGDSEVLPAFLAGWGPTALFFAAAITLVLRNRK